MASNFVSPIPKEDLAEHFYSFMNRLMGALQQTFVEENSATGLTQKEIGQKIGRSPASISRWLSGQENMTIRTMHDLARGMGCRVDVALQPLRSIQPANRPAHLEIKIWDAPISATSARRPQEYTAIAA